MRLSPATHHFTSLPGRSSRPKRPTTNFPQTQPDVGHKMKSMPVIHRPAPTPRVRRTQGIALVVTLLAAMVLMVSLLGVTSTLVVSSQRTTTDQNLTLQAQYAAEAGLARASSNLEQIQGVIEKVAVPSNHNANNVEAHIKHFCDKSSLGSYPQDYDDWTAAQKRGGVPLCEAAAPTQNGNNRYTLFTAYTPGSAYPPGSAAPGQYWRNVFSGNAAPVETKIASDSVSGTESWYRANFGLTPRYVLVMRPPPAMQYRLAFTIGSIGSTGEVRAAGRVVATRTVEKGVSGEFFIDVEKPPFSKYALFRNQTTSTSNSQLYFAGGETFDGPVHTNKKPGFYKVNGKTPVFLDTFTSAAAEQSSMYVGYNNTDRSATFLRKEPAFGIDEIPLPKNNNNQVRAAFGGDETSDAEVTAQDLARAWKVPTTRSNNTTSIAPGVYYSEGNGNTPNTGASWLGGIHVQGNVNQLRFSTANGRQIITINQGGGDTRFTENANGTWTVTAPGVNKVLSGSFNGMIYVSGSVADLSGDGSDTPDIAANTQVTVATSSDVIIKSDITYADNPVQNPDALNVFGIFSSGGTVKADGPSSKDLTVHASIMASAANKGFGTVNPEVSRGTYINRKVQFNLLGGIIEDQSQTVGNTGTGGYARNYKYDRRFKTKGLMPPFFPTQQHWTTEASQFSEAVGVWQVVAGQ